jgi:hypothetical protein
LFGAFYFLPSFKNKKGKAAPPFYFFALRMSSSKAALREFNGRMSRIKKKTGGHKKKTPPRN